MLTDHYSRLSVKERRIFWIVLVVSLIIGAFAATVVDTLIAAPNFQYFLANSIPFFLGIVSLASAVLILFGRKEYGSWVLLLGSFAALLTASLQAEGYGFPAAFVLLAITLFVPVQLLERQKAAIALGIGITGTIAIILFDTFWTLPRVPALAQDVNAARAASIVLALIILLAVALQYRDFSIRSKLLILAFGTGLLSIILVTSSTSYFTQQALRTNTRNSLISAAHHSMDQIDSFIEYSTSQIRSDAQLPDVIDYLKASPAERALLKDDMLVVFNALSESEPVNIASYALLDEEGVNIIDTFPNEIGLNKSSWDYFIIPKTEGTTYVSPVRYVLPSNESEFFLSTPVLDEDGTFLGVLRVRYRAAIFQRILINNNEFAGQGSYGLLLDEYNVVLANGMKPAWISRTLVPLEKNTFDLLRSQARLPVFASEHLSLDMPVFFNGLQNSSNGDLFFPSSDAAWGAPVEIGVASSGTMPWKIAYVQSQSAASQVIIQQRRIIVVSALATGLLIVIAGFAVAGTITKPILGLASTAEQIAAGDLSARARVLTNDEINTLAKSFNLMTDRLKETLDGLEHRVAERTADLEMARLLSERRAEELQSISEISRIISSEQKLETLLSLITQLVSEKFDFYHTGIFLIDDTRQFAVLQAANSEGGHQMLARGHRLEVGHTGLVGNVAQTGKAHIALDVGSDAVYFDNPDLPKTRSEMALPLNLRGVTIGVLDVQSTRPGAFAENDSKTLSILADQIAIAIDNARLFGQNKQALAEVQSLYDQYLRQEWSLFGKQEKQVGYFQSVVGGRPLQKAIDSDEIRTALQRGTVVIVDGKTEKSVPTIVVPVRLRGQTLGVLNIKAPAPNRRWSEDEINLAQAVSDRLALALENARLLFESQRQAAKEQKIGEVTAKIGASINMQNVLQTAVEQLGRALPGSEVIIQFQSNGKQE